MLATNTVAAGWSAGWSPEAELTVCEWAEKNIVLSSKSSAEAGPFRSSRTPYVKEILESLSPTSEAQRVVWMAGAQVAKTQSGLNWLGAIIDMWPGPTLLVEPTLELSKKLSKQRIGPMIESTPALRAKVADSRSRDAGNTMFEKEFPGGMLILTGANSAAGLRSMPIRYLFLDEVDAYPGDVEGEGSPMDLAEKRTTTFARRKVFITSTPTIKGQSAVEREYLKSDQRKFYVPCPHCGEYDTIEWPRIVYDEADPKNTARLLCQHCGTLIEERFKTQMLDAGEWRATAVSKNGTVGYHLNGLYSPIGWKSWGDCALEFIDAKGSVEKLKVWVNTVLGESWEERGDGVNPESLKARLEPYAAEVPNEARILTASVDVQGSWLEAKVKAYGYKEESWLIAHSQFHGDPTQQEVWDELDEFLAQEFTRADGATMRIDTALIDSGYLADVVYRFCKPRAGRRIYALKGVPDNGKPVVAKPTQNNTYRVKLFAVGTDAGKDIVVNRMKLLRAGPGYMHLPDWVEDEYLEQLTAEKAIRKYVKGRGTVREWVKTRPRNEAFDLEVYCLAALYSRGAAFVNNLLHRGEPAVAEAPEPEQEAPASPAQRPQVWSADTPAPKAAGGPTAAPKWGSGAAGAKWGSNASGTRKTGWGR